MILKIRKAESNICIQLKNNLLILQKHTTVTLQIYTLSAILLATLLFSRH